MQAQMAESISGSISGSRLQANLLYLVGREPVAILGVLQAVFVLGTAFGWWRWTPEENAAVAALMAGLGVRSKRGQSAAGEASQG